MPQKSTTDKVVTSASSYRSRRNEGRVWQAPSGASVRVRDLDISDHAIIGKFPDNLQQIIYRQIENSARLKPKATDDTELVETVFGALSGKELLDSEYNLGVMCCKLGWIEPRVVDDVDNPEEEISVEELNSQDRRAFLGMVFGGTGMEAQAMATFPGQSPEPE